MVSGTIRPGLLRPLRHGSSGATSGGGRGSPVRQRLSGTHPGRGNRFRHRGKCPRLGRILRTSLGTVADSGGYPRRCRYGARLPDRHGTLRSPGHLPCHHAACRQRGTGGSPANCPPDCADPIPPAGACAKTQRFRPVDISSGVDGRHRIGGGPAAAPAQAAARKRQKRQRPGLGPLAGGGAAGSASPGIPAGGAGGAGPEGQIQPTHADRGGTAGL